MEPLPRGANFQRTLMLWEIGLHIAGDPNTPYDGNRDMCISVGSGSASNFRPWLRMSTGSPILAHAVAKGELEMSMVNPSGFLTQAYRGTGLFKEALPVRVVACYPSWDRSWEMWRWRRPRSICMNGALLHVRTRQSCRWRFWVQSISGHGARDS